MKILLTFFLLFFSSSLFADNISDFQIEGMSIGDSLLDYFSEEEINSWEKNYYPKSNKFIRLLPTKAPNDLTAGYEVHIKNGDKKYIIYSIKSGKFFVNDMDGCKKYKKKIISEINPLFPNIKPDNYETIYTLSEEDNSKVKSIALITDFEIVDGLVRVWCTNWTDIIEIKKGFADHFAVNATSKVFFNWLNNEAY